MRYSRATLGSTGLAPLTVLAEDHTLMSPGFLPGQRQSLRGVWNRRHTRVIAGKASATPKAT